MFSARADLERFVLDWLTKGGRRFMRFAIAWRSRSQPWVLLAAGAFLAAAALAACGGRGGGGGGGGSCTAGTTCVNVAGTWTTTEMVDATACGNGNYTDYGTYTVTQSGSSCNLTVTDATGNSFSGAINGSQVCWSGSYPTSGGTTTIRSLMLSVSGDSLSGTASWTWTDGSTTCSGTTRTTGVRSGGGGCGTAPGASGVSVCSTASQCCSGLGCRPYYNQPAGVSVCCVDAGGLCTASAECCGFMNCDSAQGRCACVSAGGTCQYSGECCSGFCGNINPGTGAGACG